MNPIKIAGIVVASIFTLGMVSCSMEQVDAGNQGVFVRNGKAVEQAGPGLQFMNPLTTDLVEMNVRTQKYTAETIAYTKDVQRANVRYALTYHLDPKAALTTYVQKGEEWARLQIPQITDEAVKNEFGRSEAVKDAINRRGAVTEDIKVSLARKLRDKNIVVDGFEIRDISFSDNFEKAVEAKQVAVERANKARNDTVRIEEESKQKIITAQGEAEAMRIKTQALAGNPALIQYEIAKRWNGVLPGIMAGNGTVPLLPLR